MALIHKPQRKGRPHEVHDLLSLARAEEIAANVFQPDALTTHEYPSQDPSRTRESSHIGSIRICRIILVETPLSRRREMDLEKRLGLALLLQKHCEVLELDPFFMRRGLLRWKEAQTKADAITKRSAAGELPVQALHAIKMTNATIKEGELYGQRIKQ
jgi:hypothetical protein